MQIVKGAGDRAGVSGNEGKGRKEKGVVAGGHRKQGKKYVGK